MGKINDEQRNILGICQSNIDRLTRLVNNFLEYQKFEAGITKLHIEMSNLNELVQEAQKEMELMAKRKGLVCRVDFEKDLPLVACDRDKILRVIINFINNACKLTEHGEIVVRTVHEASAVCVSVTDTGIGIRAEDLSSLFQKFVQLEDGKSVSGGGTGLGLMISKKIIDAHGGKIGLSSNYRDWETQKIGRAHV